MGNFNKAYNLTKMYNDSKQSDNNLSDNNDKIFTPAAKASLLMDKNFDSLYTSCIASKHMQVVLRKKLISEVNAKFDELHVDL